MTPRIQPSIITPRLNAQRGLSLLELMISLSLGIILLLGLTSIYTVAIRATEQNEFVVATDEKSRQIFRLFAREFEQAGFVDPTDAVKETIGKDSCTHAADTFYGTLTAQFSDHESKTLNLYRRFKPKAGADKKQLTPIGRVSCGQLQPISSDKDNAITISYQIATGGNDKSLSTLPALKDVRDCTGTAFTNPNNNLAKNGFVSNAYKLENNNLVCKSNVNDKATVLIHDVQDIQFRYLVTTAETEEDKTLFDTDSGRVVEADYRTAEGSKKIADEKLGWASVVGVEICLITSIELPDGKQPTSLARLQDKKNDKYQRPQCFTNDKTEAEDQNKYYTRYNKTFSLPNALYLSPKQPE